MVKFSLKVSFFLWAGSGPWVEGFFMVFASWSVEVDDEDNDVEWCDKANVKKRQSTIVWNRLFFVLIVSPLFG